MPVRKNAPKDGRGSGLAFDPARPCLIVGNGPSVDAVPADQWPDQVIGTNRALVLSACQDVKFSALVMRDRFRALWVNQKLGEKYHADFWKPSGVWKVGRRQTHCDEYLQFASTWQGRATQHRDGDHVVLNSSVAIMALNWAWIHGARKFQLLGVDYHGGHARMIKPFEADTRGSGGCKSGSLWSIEKEFAAAVNAIQQSGGSIVNISPGTVLEAVPILEQL